MGAGPGVVFWFRQDLRLHDQVALDQALRICAAQQGWLLPVFIHDSALQARTRWGFDRVGPHRQAWQAMAIASLEEKLQSLGSRLLQFSGAPAEVLTHVLHSLGDALLVCEEVAAPEEQAVIRALQEKGLPVRTVWQSTLMAPERLPFAPEQVPDHFTAFRQAVERAGTPPEPPLPAPAALPALPPAALIEALCAAIFRRCFDSHRTSLTCRTLTDIPAASSSIQNVKVILERLILQFFIMALPTPHAMAAANVQTKPSGCPAKFDISSLANKKVANNEQITPRMPRRVNGFLNINTLANNAHIGMV